MVGAQGIVGAEVFIARNLLWSAIQGLSSANAHSTSKITKCRKCKRGHKYVTIVLGHSSRL